MPAKKKGGGGKKIGRNASKCSTYRARCRREKNAERRLRRHVQNYPGDRVAAGFLTLLG